MKLFVSRFKDAFKDVVITRVLLALAAVPVLVFAIFVGTVISAILFSGAPEP